MIAVPPAFAAATVNREGDAGRAWIQALPGLIEDLCERWRLTIDGSPLYGYLGLVIPVRRAEEPCALKVSWIDDATAEEAMALAAWDGQGAVRLLAAQPEAEALLLERLDHQRSLNDVEIGEAVALAGRLLRRLAIPAPAGFRSLALVAQDLRRSLPQRGGQCGRPLPQRWLEHACELASQLGATSANLLVNYDLHYLDVLGGEREPWLAVDPKVVSGDAEYGIAQLLWTRLDDIAANGGLERHLPLLIEAASLDAARAHAWTLVRCVDYWLWALSVGLTEDPARCEAIVTWLL